MPPAISGAPVGLVAVLPVAARHWRAPSLARTAYTAPSVPVRYSVPLSSVGVLWKVAAPSAAAVQSHGRFELAPVDASHAYSTPSVPTAYRRLPAATGLENWSVPDPAAIAAVDQR